jgi:hypothetical protein
VEAWPNSSVADRLNLSSGHSPYRSDQARYALTARAEVGYRDARFTVFEPVFLAMAESAGAKFTHHVVGSASRHLANY